MGEAEIMNNPKISVIVAVYKAELFLKECMDSLLTQTLTDLEIILVDDCSPDNCPAMCDEYAKQDARIKVIHHQINQGSIVTYRDGINCSTGDYIGFVDSDDWIEKDAMERQFKKAISEDCDIVYSSLIRFSAENKLFPDTAFDTRNMDKREIVINLIEDNFPQYLCGRLFKRDLFSNIAWPQFQLREDSVICIQLFLNAEKIGYEYSTLYHYRFNPASISSIGRYRYIKINEVFENYQMLESVLKKRSDYDIYQQAIEKILKKFRTPDRFKWYYYTKRFLMSFIPCGIIELYRYRTGRSIRKLLSMFLPYGVLLLYRRVREK